VAQSRFLKSLVIVVLFGGSNPNHVARGLIVRCRRNSCGPDVVLCTAMLTILSWMIKVQSRRSLLVLFLDSPEGLSHLLKVSRLRIDPPRPSFDPRERSSNWVEALKRSDLDEFVQCFHAEYRHEKKKANDSKSSPRTICSRGTRSISTSFGYETNR
jgi:hypothetical protein